MTPKTTEKKRITLVGMDFFGNPAEKGAGWSAQSVVGQLWQRFDRFLKRKKDSIRHLVSEAGYELWVDFEGETDDKNKYIFVGRAVETIEDLPLELVAKPLPETRYAIFTLKMSDIRSGGIGKLWNTWLPETGLKTAHDFMIEYYDCGRFKGVDNPDSEVDFMVPIR